MITVTLELRGDLGERYMICESIHEQLIVDNPDILKHVIEACKWKLKNKQVEELNIVCDTTCL